MPERSYLALCIFAAAMLALPFPVLAVEKADKDAILQEISGFIDKNPGLIKRFVFSMADEYMRQNKSGEAIALYEKALKVLPDNEEILNRMADTYNRKADYLKAAEIYERLAELKPGSVFNFQKLASAYRNAGEKDKAALVWENLTKDSKNPGIFMQAADFYSGENDMEKAVVAVKKASGLAPDNMNYLQTMEGFYVKAGKFPEAEDVCNKIFSAAKNQRLKDWAETELVNIYQKQNEAPRAEARGFFERNTERPLPIRGLKAAVLRPRMYKLGDLAARLEKDLAQAPNDINKYKTLADIYIRKNEQDKAVAQYRKAQAIDAGNLWYTMRIADIFIAKKDVGAAKKELSYIIAGTTDERLKQEAERKLKGMELSQDVTAAAPKPAPIKPAVKKEAKPEEKKKGLFPFLKSKQ